METQLVPYNIEKSTIAALQTKYMDITILPEDKAAYAMVMSGLRECREIRLAVDAWHKDCKAWIIKAGKHYDSEKRRVHGLIKPIEDHLRDVRQQEDGRIEEIKQAKIRAEEERVSGIRAAMSGMTFGLVHTQGKTAAEIQNMIDNLVAKSISKDVYQEFFNEAMQTHEDSLFTLVHAREDRQKWEDEQAAAKVEADRLAKQKIEQEAEAARLAAEKAEMEAKACAEREALEEEKRKVQAERARVEREAREAKEKAEKAEKAERDRIERERLEAEEKAQQEALRSDREKFILWIKSSKNPRPIFNNSKLSALAEQFEVDLYHLIDYAMNLGEGL